MPYDKEFFRDLEIGAEKSAKILIPIVYNKLKPKSVLDVGCGTGSWLKVWSEFSPEIFGIDGEWVDKSKLSISQDKFNHCNLENGFNLNRKFDLVTTLEVAEHIHKDAADSFVNSLVRHGDKILFSAAIPWQGGTDHFNEQWPTYWIELFKKEGYVFLDPFRHIIWNESDIKHHYRQNTILFVKKELIEGDSFLEEELKYANRSLISVVHPEKYTRARDPKHRSLKQELPELIQLIKNYITKLLSFKK